MLTDLVENMIALRRDLHQHPELSRSEHRSARAVAMALEAKGLKPKLVCGRTGLWVDIAGQEPGLGVALRADLDALPITEDTGLPFASEHPGVMHACGHDAHSALLFGAAIALHRKPAKRTVRLFWQPAEELGTGAEAMIAEGVLDGMAAVFGGHVDMRWPPGFIAVQQGAVNASTDTIAVTVSGGGGHGARPHLTTDPLLAGCQMVVALQGIISREIEPGEPAVITIGQFDGGVAENVIASRVNFRGTIRSHSPVVREQLLAAFTRVCESVAGQHRVAVQIRHERGTPSVINQAQGTQWAKQAALAVVGEEGLTKMPSKNLGGEDFAHYLLKLPGCFVRFGAKPQAGSAPAHSSRFDVHEGVLKVGADFLEQCARITAAQLSA